MVRKLKVYRGSSHPHEAQKPRALDIASARYRDR
jgi:ribosomal protein L13